MSERIILIIEIIGTVAFAISGAEVGLKKGMDIFGVAILGLTTAVGGGVIRDLILGNTPPATFRDPIYAVIAICASVVMFLPAVRRFFDRREKLYHYSMLLMDSLGLGIFTVVGIQTAYSMNQEHGVFLLIFVGVVTGVGGGILRDVMAGNTPYVFVKHFYATASLLGALLTVILWPWCGEMWSMLAGAALVLALRLLAAHFRWSLPKARVKAGAESARED